MAGQHPAIQKWVDEVTKLTTPDRVVWCDGSEAERDRARSRSAWRRGELHRAQPAEDARLLPAPQRRRTTSRAPSTSPSSAPNDKDDAGPNNNWMAPADARAKLTPLFAGAMKGRTMYVVPFLMGPPGSRFSKVGVEITDSKYVVAQHAHHDAHRAAWRSSTSATSRRLHALPALARRLSAPSAASSALPRGQRRSGRSARATAATRCSARSAWRCASRAASARRRAGSPSTC